ncbi:ROK family protein [Providencia vermicola]|uniref:Phosphoheptose isomerase n=2 Tax=Providencia TaxID=586 RepID=A0A1S1HL26_PROST|nr:MULTISPECIES: ROK family protein [Providencia]ELR5040250.1 ROK family protein [Providencia stuartii]ELR5083440.1 ROK family protein [Providencia stuartii]ELR5114471.1 ROK family protein [Providencia stuartii]ELR5300021.1 ROK family protein [Providencia stuartii]MDW7588964.1 ROK family protein [Providencia sp. 2023EL-00965]
MPLKSQTSCVITISNVPSTKRILVIDVGGTHVKLYTAPNTPAIEFVSGDKMTPEQFIHDINQYVDPTSFDSVSIGFPSPISGNRILKEPVNLGEGWVDFDLVNAFPCPIRLINDAAMQAVGSYEGGSMLFLGLGTGLGSALVVNQQLQPMEIAHLPYLEHDYEYYASEHYRELVGDEVWRQSVLTIVDYFYQALMPDYIVIGGGNVHHFTQLPKYVRRGDNDKAFLGGIRIWGNNL